jgi:hypothetical protein
LKPACSNQASAQRESASKSPSCSARASSSVWLISASACAHGERVARGVEHVGVAGVDGHARADGCLRQVHRRDVAALQVDERGGQFGLERGDKLAARGGGRVVRAFAADEDDAGGEGVACRLQTGLCILFASAKYP